MAAAKRILGNRTGFRGPQGGFFLWLEVGNGEEIALQAVARTGVRVLPGAYMGREIEPGKPSQTLAFPISGWRLLAIYQPLGPHSKGWAKFWVGRMSQQPHDGGVYQPRARTRRMSDALADARRAVTRADCASAMMRGAGALCLFAGRWRHSWRW